MMDPAVMAGLMQAIKSMAETADGLRARLDEKDATRKHVFDYLRTNGSDEAQQLVRELEGGLQDGNEGEEVHGTAGIDTLDRAEALESEEPEAL